MAVTSSGSVGSVRPAATGEHFVLFAFTLTKPINIPE